MEIDWDELDAIQDEQIRHTAFHGLDINYIPGEGEYPIAFIIGEAPGAQEVIAGRPFVGPAGRAQRDLMAIAGLHTEDYQDDERMTYGVGNCWLTNVVKFYPPNRNGSRKPLPFEVTAARPYLRREWIAVGRPRLIIPVGGVALKAVTGKPTSILRAAGKLHKATTNGIYDGQRLDLYVWPMVHPSFGLRTPAVQPLIEKDWEVLATWMRNGNHDLHFS